METTVRSEAELERATLAKITWRLMPFLFALYFFNHLNRNNINYAVLTMKPDLGFSQAVFGLGAGIFFAGYFFFQVPSNVLLERFGARRWLSLIPMAWGVVASSMLFIHDATSFYVFRFLLGVAEAGFFPGVMLYLTYWFPNILRGRATARFVLANVFSGIAGGPLTSTIMKLGDVGGLRSWQWVFLLEGIPPILLGLAALTYLTDRPEHAHWLKPEERAWLLDRLEKEREQRKKHHSITLLQAFAYPRVLHLATLFFLNVLAGASLAAFASLILRERSTWSTDQILWISSIPSILGAVTVLISASLSDRSGERRRFVITGLLVAATGAMVCAFAPNGPLTVVGLCIVAVGGQIANAPFWALATGFLTGAAAAGGIAFINSIGNSGSFFGPIFTGYLRDWVKSYQPALMLLSGIYVLAAITAYLLPPDPASRKTPE
jgi:ACS family tartrate transporter-like MFS transporter